jgi:serine protease AprX
MWTKCIVGRKMEFRLVVLLFVAVTLTSANSHQELSPSRHEPASTKIAAWVLDKTASGGEAEFFIVLSDQADLSGAAALNTKSEKGWYVYRTLSRKQQESQAPILQWLDERGIEHRSFYIVNAILVKAGRSVAVEVAARSDVARIEGNPQIQNVPPAPSVEGKSSVAAQAIEGNITYTRAPEVWAQGFTGQGAVIGGGDTGYLWNHTALKSHYRGMSGNSVEHDFNWHDSIHSRGGSCGPDSPAPCDDRGHGTHTMGIAVGDDGAGNQIGMAPGAKWIGCRNMDEGSGMPATYMECFQFFLAPYPVSGTPAQGDPSLAPDVTTNSWTCPRSEGCSALTLQAAIEAQRAAGIVTVVAAGNYLNSTCSDIVDPPSLYDAALSIGALDHTTGNIAGFSGQGPITIDGSNRMKPDITAPGVLVRSSYGTGKTVYATFSGTSMATPHVAGAIALMLSAQPNLRGKVAAIEGILKDSAVHVPLTACSSSGSPNNVYGYGRLDAKAAVDMALTTFTPTNAIFNSPGGEGLLNVSAPFGVSWAATSKVSWITIASGDSGTGNGTVSFVVSGNGSDTARAGTITIARRDFTVRQQGSGTGSCSYNVDPSFRKFPAGGGRASLTVTTTPNCIWTAASNVGWITITSDTAGLGSGTLTFNLSANTTAGARKGSIDISDTTFSMKQKAPK